MPLRAKILLSHSIGPKFGPAAGLTLACLPILVAPRTDQAASRGGNAA